MLGHTSVTYLDQVRRCSFMVRDIVELPLILEMPTWEAARALRAAHSRHV